jgi:CheY-like chemotaxis protein
MNSFTSVPCFPYRNLLRPASIIRLFFNSFLTRENSFLGIKRLFILAIISLARPLRIVLADDDEDDRNLFKEAVEETASNVKVNIVKNGEELMRFLLKEGTQLPDIIFLDLNMPVKNGQECLEEIRGNNKLKHIPVIIYSTSSSRSHVDETFNNGANLYVLKPESFIDLKLIAKEIFSIDWSNPVKPRKEKFVLNIKKFL